MLAHLHTHSHTSLYILCVRNYPRGQDWRKFPDSEPMLLNRGMDYIYSFRMGLKHSIHNKVSPGYQSQS